MLTFFSQVREAMKINSKMNEAAISSDEFTQRMANLEKKLQQVSAERDSLKEENKVWSMIFVYFFFFESLSKTFQMFVLNLLF